MTKFLSQILEAKEPQFRQTIQKLEAASGHPCEDIRLSQRLLKDYQEKLRALNLDPDDTTGEELYVALQEKLKADDARLVKRLREVSARNVSAAGEISEGIAYAVGQIISGNKVFVVKSSVIKKLIEKNAPRKTMKLLGYRSVSSMLKHEPLGLLVPIVLSIEPHVWEQRYEAAIKKLTPRDFEERLIGVFAPTSPKWRNLCLKLMHDVKQTVIVNKELGSMVILPLPSKKPLKGLTIVTLATASNGINAIYASSTYLRLSQVAKDFGLRVEKATSHEPDLQFVGLLETPLSWETVQRFFYRMSGKIDGVLEDHIHSDELIGWQPVETLMHSISPEMSFWRGCGHLCSLDGIRPVSLNILDNALCLVNHREYKNHYYHHVQRALWQELILRYIKPDLLQEVVSRELSPKLEAELVSV